MVFNSENILGQVFEKYRILRMIGKGGMGAIFEAEHIVLRRRVAIKVLHPKYSRESRVVERFLREAQAASAISHPHIIEVLDVGQTPDGALFMVMELLSGCSLSTLMKRISKIPVQQTVAIVLQLLSGLQAAHAKGIVHRDLKPDNIFLVKDMMGERVKLLDFGISKVLDADPDKASLTKTGTIPGTVLFMAPEQARGDKDIDHRVDIWATGVILYTMLSGNLPFVADSYHAILFKIVSDPVPPLQQHVPELPSALLAVVEKTLEKDRNLRYSSASVLAKDLEPFLDTNAPISIFPPEFDINREQNVSFSSLSVPVTGEFDFHTPTKKETALLLTSHHPPDRDPRAGSDVPANNTPPPQALHAVALLSGKNTPSPENDMTPFSATHSMLGVVPKISHGSHSEQASGPHKNMDASSQREAKNIFKAATELLSPGSTVPRRKYVLWWTLVCLLIASHTSVLWANKNQLLQVLGLSSIGSNTTAFAIIVWLSGVMLWSAVRLTRFWSQQEWSPWFHGWGVLFSQDTQSIQSNSTLQKILLYGSGVLFLPVVGLGLCLVHFLILRGQVDSYLHTLRSYISLSAEQAIRMAHLLESSHLRFLHMISICLFVLLIFAALLLLSCLFLPAQTSLWRYKTQRWWLIPLGLSLIAAAEFLLFPKALAWMGSIRFVLYGIWVLVSWNLIRLSHEWRDSFSPARQTLGVPDGMVSRHSAAFSPAWQTLGSGVFLTLALSGYQCTRGYTLAYTFISSPQGRIFWDDAEYSAVYVHRLMHEGFWVQSILLLVLFIGTFLWCYRSFLSRENWVSWVRQSLFSLPVFVITICPTWLCFSAMGSMPVRWLPIKLSVMQPISSTVSSTPDFYIDRAPQSLYKGRDGLWSALTSRSRLSYKEGNLLSVLKGQKQCSDILAATVRGKPTAEPARCITAVEAHLYCKSRGKRLPTPKEWQAALSKIPVSSEFHASPNALWRSTFGEWTAKEEHGTPIFFVAGSEHPSVPKKLESTDFSKAVGFRCAFRF